MPQTTANSPGLSLWIPMCCIKTSRKSGAGSARVRFRILLCHQTARYRRIDHDRTSGCGSNVAARLPHNHNSARRQARSSYSATCSEPDGPRLVGPEYSLLPHLKCWRMLPSVKTARVSRLKRRTPRTGEKVALEGSEDKFLRTVRRNAAARRGGDADSWTRFC